MGGRGPGETASELLARRLDKRLAELRKALRRVQVAGVAQRRKRDRCKRIALVGYTNAGKTTLMNNLASTELLSQDAPFVTLDTTVRCLMRQGGDVLLSDTVGFIRRLPDRLLASFETTLAELREATLIVPVIDASDPEWEMHLATTHQMLARLGAEEIPRYYVFSKADRLAVLPKKDRIDQVTLGSEFRFISNHDQGAIGELKATLLERARADLRRTKVYVPYQASQAMELVYRSCRVLETENQTEWFALQFGSGALCHRPNREAEGRTMNRNPGMLVEAENLSVSTPRGRQLFQDLNVQISQDRIAMIGRNGVGKTTLLKILAGEVENQGVVLHTTPHLVAQDLGCASRTLGVARKLLNELDLAEAGLCSDLLSQDTCSPGEQRKLHLLAARKAQPDLLVLDEPTSDLDEHGIDWLSHWLSRWRGGLLLVSHNRALLRQFQHFFVITESGCRYLSGELEDVEKYLESDSRKKQRQYLSNLNSLIKKEEKNERVNNRHDRKKNRGRLNELGRCPSRAKLNEKRSYAQVKQGRRKKLWRNRIATSREWVEATRRALDVQLELRLAAPPQPTDTPRAIVGLNEVTVMVEEREIFSDVSLCIQRTDRIAIAGRNGAGKTTLLSLLAGQRQPDRGQVVGDFSRIGMIEQGAANWQSADGLLENLQAVCDVTLDDMAKILVEHRFPLGLAERPLRSLSPGERVRAALICLYHRAPVVELLVLDEPTVGLDFVGLGALRDALQSWPGAMVVVSHDRDFIEAMNVNHEIRLDLARIQRGLPDPVRPTFTHRIGNANRLASPAILAPESIRIRIVSARAYKIGASHILSALLRG